MYDLIIIGGGPAGLAGALAAKKDGLDYLVLEQGVIADTVYRFPIARQLFSTADELELEPGTLNSKSKPTREELLKHYTELAVHERVNIHTGEEVVLIAREAEGFIVKTSTGKYTSRTVLAAIGGFGRVRRLDVPGENPLRVSYRFVEAYPFTGKKVLVAGGGNSAAEATLSLAGVGASVTLSVRRPTLASPIADRENGSASIRGAAIKSWVLRPLERARDEGVVRVVTSSEILEIRAESALIAIKRGETGERVEEIECERIFALIGADPETKLLERAGVELAPDGRPLYHPQTYETSVPGLYVAGHLTRERHIKNAVGISRRVVNYIAAQVLRESLR